MTTEMQFYVMGTLCLVVRALLLYRTWKVMQNFKRGLRGYFDEGHHYIDFWGTSTTKLLDTAQSQPVNSKLDHTMGMAGMTETDAGNLSSRSRINSSDFD